MLKRGVDLVGGGENTSDDVKRTVCREAPGQLGGGPPPNVEDVSEHSTNYSQKREIYYRNNK